MSTSVPARLIGASFFELVYQVRCPRVALIQDLTYTVAIRINGGKKSTETGWGKKLTATYLEI